MTAGGPARSREAHKVLPGLQLVPVRSHPGWPLRGSRTEALTVLSCQALPAIFLEADLTVSFPRLRSWWLPSPPVTKGLLGLSPLLPTEA